MTRRGLLGLTGVLTGCGYHVGGKSDLLPKSLQTIAVPVFNNLTVRYKLADRPKKSEGIETVVAK